MLGNLCWGLDENENYKVNIACISRAPNAFLGCSDYDKCVKCVVIHASITPCVFYSYIVSKSVEENIAYARTMITARFNY